MARLTTPTRERWPPPKTKLAALIDEAIVDAYGASEQRTAFYTLLDQHGARVGRNPSRVRFAPALKFPYTAHVAHLNGPFGSGRNVYAICFCTR